jgi:alpha-tubulin suppressor-like RCC1 family protein
MKILSEKYDDYRKFSKPMRLLTPQVKIIKISAGTDHYCMLDSGGSFWSSGDNQFGNLGSGDDKKRATPS